MWDSVFTNAKILTHIDHEGYHVIEQGALAVSGSRIDWIGEVKTDVRRDIARRDCIYLFYERPYGSPEVGIIGYRSATRIQQWHLRKAILDYIDQSIAVDVIEVAVGRR